MLGHVKERCDGRKAIDSDARREVGHRTNQERHHTRPIHNCMPVNLDKADIRLWLADIRLWLNGSGAELLRSAAEDRIRLWPPSRRVNNTGNGDDDATLVDEVAASWAFGPTPAV